MTHTLTYRIHEVAPYINWIYFFHAWGFPPRFAAISRIHGCDACRAGWLAEFPEEERARAAEAMQLFKDANRMLAQLDGDFHTHVRFGLYPACSDGDDLLLTDPEQEGRTLRLALLRQQHTTKPDEPYLCLSDFVRPLSQGISDTVGVFAATVDADMEHLYETGAYADDFKHLLAQTLSDRLAEASTEKMHQEVRTTYWGYAKDEQWSIEDLLVEKFTGIRPAVGYPSLPDQSVNFVLSEFLMKSDEEIAGLFMPILKEHGIEAPMETVVTVVGLMKGRVSFIKELWDTCKFFFVAPTEYDEKTVKKRWKEDSAVRMTELADLLESLDDFSLAHQEEVVMKWIEDHGYHMGNIMNAFRLTLVGEGKGPHMFDISAVLGKEETVRRMRRAVEVLK